MSLVSGITGGLPEEHYKSVPQECPTRVSHKSETMREPICVYLSDPGWVRRQRPHPPTQAPASLRFRIAWSSASVGSMLANRRFRTPLAARPFVSLDPSGFLRVNFLYFPKAITKKDLCLSCSSCECPFWYTCVTVNVAVPFTSHAVPPHLQSALSHVHSHTNSTHKTN